MCFITELHTGNVQFEASKLKMLHENGNHGRADDFQYVVHHLASFITETTSYCERSELSGLFNGTDFIYIFQAVRRAVNVLNVSTCI